MNIIFPGNNNQHNILFRYSLLASLIGVISIISLYDQNISDYLVVIESFLLLFFLLKKEYCEFYALFLIVTSLSIGSGTFAGTDEFYGWNTIKFFKIELAYWFLVLFSIVSILFKKDKLKANYKQFWKFTHSFVLLCSIATVVGLITIAVNDNNICSISNYWSQFFATIYIMAAFPLFIIFATYYCKVYDYKHFYKIKAAILSIFIGCSAQALYSFANLITINYGGVEGIGLAIASICGYAPLSLCSFFYVKQETGKNHWLYLLTIIAGLFIITTNNASGKMLILLFLTLIILYNITDINLRLVLVLLFGFFSLVGFVFWLEKSLFSQSYLLSHKIDEVFGLFNVFSDNWLASMPASPQFRVSEFLNTCIEYLDKPWYIVTGKGYLGSIKDHLGMFRRVGGEFSEYQWSIGSFYYLHESFNLLLLNNGIMGIALWLKVLSFVFKNYKKSFFILFGGIWFCLTYGYSIHITCVGMTSLVIGFFDFDDVNSHIRGNNN